MTPEDELLPCPWHPEAVRNVHRHGQSTTFYVECYGGCRGPKERTESGAIAAWNRRTPSQPIPNVAPEADQTNSRSSDQFATATDAAQSQAIGGVTSPADLEC